MVFQRAGGSLCVPAVSTGWTGDTSGLTIVAKHAVSAAILGQMVRAKAEQGLKAPGIHRTYLALVEGKVGAGFRRH